MVPDGPALRRALLLLGAALTAVIAANALVQGTESEWLTRWTYDLVALLAVGVLVSGAVARQSQRVPLALLAVGMALTTVADVVWDVLDASGSTAAPSIADVLYLLAYVPLIAAAAVALRPPRGSGRGPWLDGVLAVLALGSVSALLVVGPIADGLDGATSGEVFTNLAYPVADVLLVGTVVALLALRGWQADGIAIGLALGATLWVVVDSLYVVDVAEGVYAIGGLLDAGWLASYLLIACAAVVPEHVRLGFSRRTAVVPPISFTLMGVVVLALAAAVGEGLATGLAVATLVVVVLRLALTVLQNDALLEASRVEAETDALTGLGNRRKLLIDLELACGHARQQALVLFDLDGFKAYNDDFGHPAGDSLLRMIGERLAEAVGVDGRAYRLGGDEFCALVPLTRDDGAGLVGRRLAAALVHEGQGFRVAASHGTVVVPTEAAEPAEALGAADRRMYACKHGRRSHAGRQTAEVLLAVLSERTPDLGEHVGEVAALAAGVARRLGLDDGDVEVVRQAAALHDVGKIAIPESILMKPAPLDEEEWKLMRQHTVIGQRVLSAAPSLAPVGLLVRSSHERWDGRGYPDGEAGEQIPIGARIIAVCDAFDAMVADRPYGAAVPEEAALAELRRCAGSQFDPAVVQAFVAELAARAAAPPEPVLELRRAGRSGSDASSRPSASGPSGR